MLASDAAAPPRYREPETARAIAAIAASFERLLCCPLADLGEDPVAALWGAASVIVAHGTEPDPLFFFGNRAALDAFECALESFIGMPSRLTAEAPAREAREAMLAQVAARGFVSDYAGTRVTVTGRRFRIEQAIIWDVSDARGRRIGQAACFTV